MQAFKTKRFSKQKLRQTRLKHKLGENNFAHSRNMSKTWRVVGIGGSYAKALPSYQYGKKIDVSFVISI